MNSIKSGVIFYGIKPETTLCHVVVQSIFNLYGIPCIPTAIVGKQHKEGSLHPVGYAIDYRTKHIMADKDHIIESLFTSLRKSLPQCDFIYEHQGKPQEHIHMEYDPKDDPVFQADKNQYKLTGVWPK